jgi:hypothetical protein
MQIHGANAAISLEAEQSLRIESRNDVEIVCLSGRLWVTQPGDARDLFVAPGEPLRLVPSGLTLVTAMVPTVLHARELPAVAGGRAWRRWALRSIAPPPAPPVLRVDLPAGQARRSVR